MAVDPSNPNRELDPGPRQIAKPTASAPMTRLTDAEHADVLHWLQNCTAIGRLAGGEVTAALAKLEADTGFILVQGPADV